MIGGMVKSDCDDPQDSGTFCWSDETQALILGSYFYGYSVQLVPAFIAKHFTAYTFCYRFWLVSAAAIQFSLPTLSAISPTIVIVSQVVRGFLGGIMASYNFSFVSKWVVARENKIVISCFGALASLGCGTAAFVSGIMSTSLGWEYVFYFSGALYLLGFVLNLLFVQDLPQNSWYLNREEKEVIAREIPPVTLSADNNMGSVICQLYLPAFCLYACAYNLVIYNLINVLPFYFYRVLGASTLFISYLNTATFLALSITSLMCGLLVQRVDLYLTWINSRMIFIVLPMMLQLVLNIVLPFVTTVAGGVIMVALSAISGSAIFSGGIYLASYEMDPASAPFLISIMNSVGQISGFIGPILMAKITYTDPDIEDFKRVYQEKWGYFFYLTGGVAAAACLAIVLSYIVRPKEWVNRSVTKHAENKEELEL